MNPKEFNEYLSKLKDSDLEEYEEALKEQAERRRNIKGGIHHTIGYYEHLADREKVMHHTLQIIILVGATSLPLLVNIPEISKVIPTVISLIVAIAAALANYFKFGARSREFNQTAEKLIQEMDDEHYRLGPYKEDITTEERIELFQDRTYEIMKEQRLRTFSFDEDRHAKRNASAE